MIVPVKADGYWTEGWWDDANQVWHEGYWTEYTDVNYVAQPYSEWRNGAEIKYDAYGNWTGTVVTNVPYFSQRDGRWAGVVIGNASTIANNGCIPSVAAMVAGHFGYQTNPLELSYLFNSWGHYNADYGHGTDTGVWAPFAGYYGLTYRNYLDEWGVKQALMDGMLVTACIRTGGYYTHCVVLYGLDQYGNTNVLDPISGYRTQSVNSIVYNASYDWVDLVDGGPFIAIGTSW